MRRRDALHGFATVCIGLLAGCGGDAGRPRNRVGPPTEPDKQSGSAVSEDAFRVASLDYRADDRGNLVVVVSVANDDDHERSGTLRASIGANGERMQKSADVTVQAGKSTEVAVPFAMNLSDFEQSGSIDLTLE